MVNCVGGDGEDGALREVVACDGDTRPRGNDTGKTEGRGRMDAEGFVDYIM